RLQLHPNRGAAVPFSGAPIYCAGPARSRSRASVTRSSTPMRSPWRWRSSRSPRRSPASPRPAASSRACGGSPLRSLEVFQVRRLLILLGGHQVAVRADEIILILDVDMLVVLGADRFAPDRLRIWIALVF